MAPTSTNTIKLAVYQDLWQGDWQVFIEGPMKQVMLAFPILTLCKTPEKFHPPVDEDHLDNVILDIWGRQWASPSGARVNKDKAVCWTALSHHSQPPRPLRNQRALHRPTRPIRQSTGRALRGHLAARSHASNCTPQTPHHRGIHLGHPAQ